jgi:hypothetical protein
MDDVDWGGKIDQVASGKEGCEKVLAKAKI